jgi:hypothetical protein
MNPRTKIIINETKVEDVFIESLCQPIINNVSSRIYGKVNHKIREILAENPLNNNVRHNVMIWSDYTELPLSKTYIQK